MQPRAGMPGLKRPEGPCTSPLLSGYVPHGRILLLRFTRHVWMLQGLYLTIVIISVLSYQGRPVDLEFVVCFLMRPVLGVYRCMVP